MIRLTASAIALSLLPAFTDPPESVVLNAVPDRYRPIASDQQRLAGVFSERMRAAREGYLEHVSDKALLSPSSDGARQAANVTSPAARAGSFLSAAAIAYEYSRDPDLKGIMDRVAKELISASSRHRYPDSSPDGRNGIASGPWLQRCDLLGLLAYYRTTGNEDALTASRKIGDLIVSNSNQTSSDATHSGSSVLLEPVVYLYRYTGDPRYLELAKFLAGSWLRSRATRADAKYQDLLDLIGLVELYRITGNQQYFRPAVATWDELRAINLTLAGAPDLGDGSQDEMTTNVCVTTAWVQLTLDLLRITAQPHYGEQLEETIYNQLFASQDPRTGNVFSSVPFDGDKKPGTSADPCAAADAAGISLIPAAVWGRSGNGIAVVLYTPGRATFQLRRRGTVQLYSETSYPETGTILLHVEPAHNIQFPLRLRVPAWTTNFVADIGGSHLLGKPGEYLTISRQWTRGDTVKIAMNIPVKVIDGGVEHAGYLAIRRGNQLLALSKPHNPGMTDFAAAGPQSTNVSQLGVPSPSGFPATSAGNQIYTVAGEYNGQPRELVLVPFADAVSSRVWMRKPRAAPGTTDH